MHYAAYKVQHTGQGTGRAACDHYASLYPDLDAKMARSMAPRSAT
jgi:hypothetical protein